MHIPISAVFVQLDLTRILLCVATDRFGAMDFLCALLNIIISCLILIQDCVDAGLCKY